MRTEVKECARTEEERQDLFIDPARERARLAARTELPPHRFDRHEEWKPVTGGSWSYHDHISLGEARGGLETLQVAVSNPAWHRRRHLFLCDNRCVCGSFTKGRSPSCKLNRIIRKVCSIQLGSGMQLLIAWIKSNWQPAGKLSRDKRQRNALQASRRR